MDSFEIDLPSIVELRRDWVELWVDVTVLSKSTGNENNWGAIQ